MADQWDFWRRRLAGEVIPIHDGEPQPGFYRVGTPDRQDFQPIAYWFASDGTLRCKLGPSTMLELPRAHELWTFASKNPIPKKIYDRACMGVPWPDMHEVVTLSNNAPPDDSIESLGEAIADLAREAEKLIKAGPAESQADADRAADLANRISTLQKKADKARETEKYPHLEACRVVDNKWRPVLAAADIYKAIKSAVIDPFLKAERDRKAAAEAEARRLAAEAARSGDAAKAEAARRAASIAANSTKAGTRGHSIALRTVTIVEIEDREKLLAYFADRQELTALLQSLAEKAVRAGITVPGVKVTKEQQAA